MKPALGLAFSVFTLLVTACGYHLGTVKPASYESINTLYVPTFKSDILEPRLAVLATNAFTGQLQRDGTYRVGNASNSDAIVDATVAQVDRRQARSSRFNTLRTSELELTLEVTYQFRDLRDNAILDSGSVTAKTSQFVDPNFQVSERQALALASEKVAEKLVSRLSEGW